MKNKKYEIIEESRFLNANELEDIRGGADGGIEPCKTVHEFCNLVHIVQPCAANFTVYCGPGNGLSYGCCSPDEQLLCSLIYSVEA